MKIPAHSLQGTEPDWTSGANDRQNETRLFFPAATIKAGVQINDLKAGIRKISTRKPTPDCRETLCVIPKRRVLPEF
jgi:hypothetical protein